MLNPTLTIARHGRNLQALGRNRAIELMIMSERRTRAEKRLSRIRASARAKAWQLFVSRITGFVRKTDVEIV